MTHTEKPPISDFDVDRHAVPNCLAARSIKARVPGTLTRFVSLTGSPIALLVDRMRRKDGIIAL